MTTKSWFDEIQLFSLPLFHDSVESKRLYLHKQVIYEGLTAELNSVHA